MAEHHMQPRAIRPHRRLLPILCRRVPTSAPRSVCAAAVVRPAGQRTAGPLRDLLPGEPCPGQRGQVQRGVLGLSVSVRPRCFLVHDADAAVDVDAAGERGARSGGVDVAAATFGGSDSVG
jgi:hypothetical protein